MAAVAGEGGRAVDTNRHHPSLGPARRNGQAFVELILGIIVIVMILAGGIQYLAVANAHRGLTTTVRGEAGARALSDLPELSTPSYIRTWDAGRDGIRHTDDDTPETTLPWTLYTIADHSVRDVADWDRLDPLARASPMLRMHESLLPTAELDLISVERSDTVVVDPAVRTFIYDVPIVTVEHTVWLPLLGGLY